MMRKEKRESEKVGAQVDAWKSYPLEEVPPLMEEVDVEDTEESDNDYTQINRPNAVRGKELSRLLASQAGSVLTI